MRVLDVLKGANGFSISTYIWILSRVLLNKPYRGKPLFKTSFLSHPCILNQTKIVSSYVTKFQNVIRSLQLLIRNDYLLIQGKNFGFRMTEVGRFQQSDAT